MSQWIVFGMGKCFFFFFLMLFTSSLQMIFPVFQCPLSSISVSYDFPFFSSFQFFNQWWFLFAIAITLIARMSQLLVKIGSDQGDRDIHRILSTCWLILWCLCKHTQACMNASMHKHYFKGPYLNLIGLDWKGRYIYRINVTSKIIKLCLCMCTQEEMHDTMHLWNNQ